MAKRCDGCKYWHDSVFLGESVSGYGCWQGWCSNRNYHNNDWYSESKHHNLWLACDYFEQATEDRWADVRENHELVSEVDKVALDNLKGNL